jgi:hypothetical protein
MLNGSFAKLVVRSWKDSPLEHFVLAGKMKEISFLTKIYRIAGLLSFPIAVSVYIFALCRN